MVFLRLIGCVLLYTLFAAILNVAGVSQHISMLVGALLGISFFIFFTRKANRKDKIIKVSSALKANPDAKFVLDGTQDVLEIFESKLIITPKQKLTVIINKGLKGSKTIPFKSISSIQLKEAVNNINGYIQFGVLGGNESRGGIFAAVLDENTCMFDKKNNDLAIQIRSYVESKLAQYEVGSNSVGISEEISRLAKLKDRGVLSEEEFKAAKGALIR